MAITQRTIKLLWANAAGRCAFPDCRARLSLPAEGNVEPHTIGEMAHIKGKRPNALRHDAAQSTHERDDYTNLILLCPTHHTTVDKVENLQSFSVEILHAIKSEHEAYISSRLDTAEIHEKHDVAQLVFPMQKENFEVFSNFGPKSRIARRNPDSDAHQIWLSERLSTIVPNNRKIATLVTEFMSLFLPEEQVILQNFLLHVRTYEHWVLDEVSYEGVVRFPSEFADLIERLSDASA